MPFSHITSDIAPLDPKDDGRHPLRDEPLCRESLVFTFQLPEQKIAGWIYPRVGSDGNAAGIISVFGEGVPGGSIYEVYHDLPVPADMDFTAWDAGGVQLQLTEPLKSAHVKYNSDRLLYDFNFEAIHPAYSYDSHPDGCPQYFADNRFEQGGLIKGHIAIDGQVIDIDGVGQRDHSWGTRNWRVNYHYKWFHATAPEAAVHFFKMDYLGRSLTRGYVFKDGHFSQLKEVNVIDFNLNEDMIHTDIEVELYDLAGRTTRVTGQYIAHQPLAISDFDITLNEVAMTTAIDGHKGTGWCEFQWNDDYLEHMKTFKELRR